VANILAVDIGGTKLAMGIADAGRFAATGALDHIVKEPIPAPGTPDAVIARILALARELAGRQAGAIGSIGISIGGPLDHRSGTVINFPHLPGWRDIALRDILSEALGAPAALDNDANLGALAEHRWGAGRGAEDMVYLTISTGIGGGVIVGGRLVHGVGSGAGEVGHITVQTGGPRCPCGNLGCLEMMASGTAIARRAREAAAREPGRASALLGPAGGEAGAITSDIVARAAAAGDPLAAELWEETAEYIAIGLGSIIHVLAPETIVLGGGVAQTGEQLLAPVRERLHNHVFYVPVARIAVVAASLGHDSALIGAASLAGGTIGESAVG
jgi:glucokinase